MGKYFDKCKTPQELSRERSRLLAEINKEFSDRNKELSAKIRTLRSVPVYRSTEYKQVQPTAYVAFNIDDTGLSNEIIVDLDTYTVTL